MDQEKINALLEDIDVSMHIFPIEKEGKIDFIPLDEVFTDETSISFSVILTVDYNLPLDCNLELTLIKLDEENANAFSSFKLTDIILKNESDIISDPNVVESFNKRRRIDVKDYGYKGTFRYDFENVPLNGYGLYYLSVLITDDTIISLKSLSINISPKPIIN